jgi:hypothetical protein
MDGTRIQSLIYSGYAKAALRTGLAYSLFRPSGAMNPLAGGNARGTILATLDADPTFRFGHPNLYGHPIWYVLADGTQLALGDYLTRPDGSAFFVAGMQPLLPIWAVECNRTISVLRPGSNSGIGAQPYGGDVVAAETPLMTGWPASVLTKSRGEQGDVRLPGDVKLPWNEVLLPYGGVQIEFADVLTDENGVRYKVSSTERTDAGWRMLAAQATA